MFRITKDRNTLYIPLEVENVKVNAVIDTAAQVSVMNMDLYKKLKPTPHLTDSIVLKAAGINNDIQARLAKNVNIRVGDVVKKWDVVVGEIADSLLLGLDFLEHCSSIIDLQNYTITFDGNVLPIRQFGTGQDKKVDVFQV